MDSKIGRKNRTRLFYSNSGKKKLENSKNLNEEVIWMYDFLIAWNPNQDPIELLKLAYIMATLMYKSNLPFGGWPNIIDETKNPLLSIASIDNILTRENCDFVINKLINAIQQEKQDKIIGFYDIKKPDIDLDERKKQIFFIEQEIIWLFSNCEGNVFDILPYKHEITNFDNNKIKKKEEERKKQEEKIYNTNKKKRKKIITLSIVGTVVAIIVGLIVGTSISNKVNSSPDKLVISGEKAVLCENDSKLILSMDLELSNNSSKSISGIEGKFELFDENDALIDEMESYTTNDLRYVSIGPHESQEVTVNMILSNAINYEMLLNSTNPEDINIVFTITSLRFKPGKLTRNLDDEREISFSEFDNQYKKQFENKMSELKNNLPQMLEENGWLNRTWFDSTYKWEITQINRFSFLCKFGNNENKVLELICAYDVQKDFVEVISQYDEQWRYEP